ncbi:MAG TPA: protein kinase [Labilithrix sp.]|nr:protein kinase [Labilithrix sp.]
MLAALGVLSEDQTLDRYELLTPIGRGGMAVVWAARLRGTRGFSKIVAIKTMLPALSVDPRFESMFLTEANIASRIKHPNVCPILDVGEDRGILFIVMEWIDGESLSTIMDACAGAGERLPYDVAAYIVAQAARGLLSAHELRTETGEPCGVVHRDVSPQNVLVTSEGIVQIVDFGIAKTAERSEQRTDTGFIKGKVAYLAPEQVEHGKLDARADVFSLGVVLYELTTGTHPFRGPTDLATLLAISCSEPAPPPPIDGYPEALRHVLERALAKDRDQRYASMRQLATDLEAFVAREGSGADRAASVIGALLREHREQRALALQQAVDEADERAERRGALGQTAANPPAVSADARVAERPRRSTSLLVGVAALGIAAGALSVRASQSASSPASVPSAPSAMSVAAAESGPTSKPPEQIAALGPGALGSSASPPATSATMPSSPALARRPQVKSGPPHAVPSTVSSAAVTATEHAPAAISSPIFRQPGF